MRAWLCRVLAVAVIVMGLPVMAGAGPALAAGQQWNDGAIAYSGDVLNCNTWNVTKGMGAYAGFFGDVNGANPQPRVGQAFYLHVVVAAIGNPCAGQLAWVDLQLPGGVTPAVSPATPVYCFFDGLPAQSACSQNLMTSAENPGSWNLGSTRSDRLWLMPFGRTLEIRVPVVSAAPIYGTSSIRAHVRAIDGFDNAWMRPAAQLMVFGASLPSPTITYPTPSTDVQGGTPTAAVSSAYLTTNVGGTVFFDIGTTTAYGLFTDTGTVPAAGSYTVQTNWVPPSPGFALQPNTTYHWRMRFQPTSGSPVLGTDQTFTTPAAGVAKVGDGSAGSCTGAALESALLSTAPTVTFDCGLQPVTITLLNSYVADNGDTVTIDGGGRVTLQAAAGTRHFRVGNLGAVTLKNLRLAGGSAPGLCGGALLVNGGGTLTLHATTVTASVAANGGGVCVETGGLAEATMSYISDNDASSNGGGVWNAGTFFHQSGEISANSAGASGGGVFNQGSAELRLLTVAENQAPNQGGGGAYNSVGGDLTLATSTVSSNSAATAGGIYVAPSSTATVSGVTLTANSATNGSTGGGLVSAGLTTVRNTLLGANSPQTCSSTGTLRLFNDAAGNLDQASTCGLTAAGNRNGVDPQLLPLAVNGGDGRSRTHAIPAGSPAVDAVPSGNEPFTGFYDQRGVGNTGSGGRAIDGDGVGGAASDIGSFELQPDSVVPTVAAAVVASVNPTDAPTASWTVTFSEPVRGVGVDDFAVSSNGVAGAAVTGVSPSTGPATTYQVTVGTGSGSGLVRLDVVDDDSIRDLVGNRLGGTGVGNGSTTGETLAVQRASGPPPGGNGDPPPGGPSDPGPVLPPGPPPSAPELPSAPSGVTVRAKPGKVIVRWARPTGAVTGSIVQCARKGRATWRTIATTGPAVSKAVWRRATKGDRYALRVAHVSGAGRGPWSSVVRVRAR